MMRRREESVERRAMSELFIIGFFKQKTLRSLAGLFFALLLSLPALRSPLYAAFEDKGTGARQTALGDTFVASGNDAYSLMVNPAGLAQLHERMAASEYSKLYAGLSDGSNLSQYYLGYAQPIKWGGTLSVGWKQFSLEGLYQERTLSLGYGEWLTDRIAIGGALKQLYHAFETPSIIVNNSGQVQNGTPQFFAQNGNSNTAYAGDIGALFKVNDRNTVGFSVQDINEPNVALSKSDHEIVPRTVRLGITRDVGRGLSLSASLMTRQALSNQTDKVWTGASEKWWDLKDSSVAVRGSLATGSREYRVLSIGTSYKLQKLQIDYAFVFNLGGISFGDTLGTHRFSFGYRFGPKSTGKVRMDKNAKAGDVVIPEITVPASEWPMTSTPAVAPQYPTNDIVAEELSIMLTKDTDNDGILDDFDKCANTPAGVPIDKDGCPTDADKDGVPDYMDQCQGTLPGTAVGRNGCALPTQVEIEFLPLEELLHNTPQP